MAGAEVRLKGTWFRKNTYPDDITMMRKYSYSIRRLALVTGTAPTVKFSLIAKQGTRSTRSAQDRVGTFESTVRVDETNGRYLPSYRAERRARQIFRWFLEDTTCRPPKLVFDSAVVIGRYR